MNEAEAIIEQSELPVDNGGPLLLPYGFARRFGVLLREKTAGMSFAAARTCRCRLWARCNAGWAVCRRW